MQLKDKVAVITGGANGIGASIAGKFIEEGATVISADIDEKNGKVLEKVINSIFPRKYIHYFCNVRKESNIKELIEYTFKIFGKIDILVNNAGIGSAEDYIEKTNTDAFDASYATTLRAVMLGMKHVTPYMKKNKGGIIINMSSQAARMVGFTGHCYAAVKAGIEALSRAVAMELAQHRIRVNCIAPAGVARTKIFGTIYSVDNEELRDFLGEALSVGFIKKSPLRKACMPEDIADTALFLASDLSSKITGQTIQVDCGVCNGILWNDFAPHKKWFEMLKKRFNLPEKDFFESLERHNKYIASLKGEIE